MKRQFLWIPTALISASLLLAACGGDDDDTNGDTGGANGEPTESMSPDNGTDDGMGSGDGGDTGDDNGMDDGSGDGGDGTGSDNGADGGGMTPGTVSLEALNDSGMSGEATVAESEGGVEISVVVSDSAATGTASVHGGTCDDYGEEPEAEIGSLEAGMATANVELAMDELTAEDHAIVVMDDGGEAVACGEVAG